MAQITLTIPDNQVQRILDAVAGLNGFTGTDPQGQPETQAQFARRMIGENLRAQVRAWEQRQIDTSTLSIT